MSLRIKIFLLALFITLFVGGLSTVMFANSWKSLAKGYGLSSIELQLENLDLNNKEVWALDIRGNEKKWVIVPQNVTAENLEAMAQETFKIIQKTQVKEGSFEIEYPFLEGATYFLAFEQKEQGVLRVVGIDSSASLLQLSPWAAPFLGSILVGLMVAGFFSFAVSSSLNKDYLSLERALENIGLGKFKAVDIPYSKDPSVKRLGLAIKNTSDLLLEKDLKIQQANTLATHDPMTGVPNFRAFQEYMEGIMSGSFSPGSLQVLGIIDLDFFKKVNDNHGHQVGDFVLKETTRLVKEATRIDSKGATRTPDFFGRYGGEEFVVIFTSVKKEFVHVGAQRILHKIKNTKLTVPANISETKQAFEMNISCSIGLAIFNGKEYSSESWIKEADQALYEAKHSGRGRIVILKPERKEWT